MIPSLAADGLAFLSGMLSILSPCILPLLPIVLGAAQAEHSFGAAALVLGVVASFVAIGFFVAAIGFQIGFDGDAFRTVAAVPLIVFGLVLSVPSLQSRIASAGGPLSDFFDRRSRGFSTSSIGGHALLGVLLGAAWAPCAGPTLGAASLLAARGESPAAAALTMGAFGVGAALPLATLGALSRRTQSRWRRGLLAAAAGAKKGLGAALVSTGFLILTRLDKWLETALLAIFPEWLIALTTSY